MRTRIYLLLMLTFIQQLTFAQHAKKLDSLQNQLERHRATKMELRNNKQSINDSTEANILFGLARIYIRKNPDTATIIAKHGLQLSEQIDYKKGVAKGNYVFGGINYKQGNYNEAEIFYKKSLAIEKELENKDGIATTYLTLGNVSFMRGNFPESMKYYYDALKIREAMGDVAQSINLYVNIGNIYGVQGNHSEALKVYLRGIKVSEKGKNKKGVAVLKSWAGGAYSEMGNHIAAIKMKTEGLKIFEEIKDRRNTAAAHSVIGREYIALKSYDSAMAHCKLQLAIAKELDDPGELADALECVGNTLFLQSKFNEASKNYTEALKIYQQLNDKHNISDLHFMMGDLNFKQNDFAAAKTNYQKGLSLAKEINSLDAMQQGYFNLAKTDSALSDFKSAFENRGLYMAIKDSMFNTEKSKKINTMQMQYDFDKKESIARQEAKNKLRVQRIYTIGGLSVLLIVTILLIFVFRNYRKQKHANEVLTHTQNKLIATEKMAAFGIMASRVAHEIQNPLNFVNNFSEINNELVDDFLKSKTEVDKQEAAIALKENSAKINLHGKRAEAIVTELQKHIGAGTAHEFFEEK